MVKVTLEEGDLIKLIKDKYPGAEIIGDTLQGIEVSIRVVDFQPPTTKAPSVVDGQGTPEGYFKTHDGRLIQVPEQNRPKPVIVRDGSIDANASGMTLEPATETIPGGRMARVRGNLPRF